MAKNDQNPPKDAPALHKLRRKWTRQMRPLRRTLANSFFTPLLNLVTTNIIYSHLLNTILSQ